MVKFFWVFLCVILSYLGGYIVGFSSKIAFKFGKYLIKRHKEKIKRAQAIMNDTIDYSKLSNDELKAIINGEFDK